MNTNNNNNKEWEDVEEFELCGDYRSKEKIYSRKTKDISNGKRYEKPSKSSRERKSQRLLKQERTRTVEESSSDIGEE